MRCRYCCGRATALERRHGRGGADKRRVGVERRGASAPGQDRIVADRGRRFPGERERTRGCRARRAAPPSPASRARNRRSATAGDRSAERRQAQAFRSAAGPPSSFGGARAMANHAPVGRDLDAIVAGAARPRRARRRCGRRSCRCRAGATASEPAAKRRSRARWLPAHGSTSARQGGGRERARWPGASKNRPHELAGGSARACRRRRPRR